MGLGQVRWLVVLLTATPVGLETRAAARARKGFFLRTCKAFGPRASAWVNRRRPPRRCSPKVDSARRRSAGPLFVTLTLAIASGSALAELGLRLQEQQKRELLQEIGVQPSDVALLPNALGLLRDCRFDESGPFVVCGTKVPFKPRARLWIRNEPQATRIAREVTEQWPPSVDSAFSLLWAASRRDEIKSFVETYRTWSWLLGPKKQTPDMHDGSR